MWEIGREFREAWPVILAVAFAAGYVGQFFGRMYYEHPRPRRGPVPVRKWWSE